MQNKDSDISIRADEFGLKQRNRDLAMLLDLNGFLSTCLDLKELLEGSLSRLMGYFDFDAGRIYKADEDGTTLNLISYKGLDPTGLERMGFGEGFSGQAVRTKSFLVREVNAVEDRTRARILAEKGFKFVVCVPMLVEDRAVGVINFTSRHVLDLDQRKVDLLLVMTHQIVIAQDRVRVYEDLRNKVRELQDKNRTIELFAYYVSHDLKNPALVIHGFARLLQKRCQESLTDEGKGYSDRILRSAEQLVTLIDEINMFIKAKRAPLQIEPLSMEELINTLHEEFSETLRLRKITLSLPDMLPVIAADKISILRIFRNLIDNALKYGGENMSTISISYEGDLHTHVFKVTDDGVGIPENEAKRIMEPFHRNHAPKGTEGAGLGLPIVKELIERHGGSFSMDQIDGKGASFCIRIAKRPDRGRPR